ncbi:MAG: PDGLE domain-containing protein [Candidatus Omnitrophica bacterium]|jgi:hypothetical protein|nr:PDGLE domain-containing protein [Candidatus Omnitrophota bacterium]MDD5660279.1 PDGLE domain-containing protein [Candidatus Omnitrophota bacterium]
MKTISKLWFFIGILIVLSPLGLLLPEYFKAGSAWGEWGVDEILQMVGYLPEGLGKISRIWNAPIPDYTFKGQEEAGLLSLSLGYIASALIGILAVVVLVFLITKFLSKKDNL